MFVLGLTTGGVEIGLPSSLCLHYNILLAIYQDGILHKFASNILSVLYIASNSLLCYNRVMVEKVTLYECHQPKYAEGRIIP